MICKYCGQEFSDKVLELHEERCSAKEAENEYKKPSKGKKADPE